MTAEPHMGGTRLHKVIWKMIKIVWDQVSVPVVPESCKMDTIVTIAQVRRLLQSR
jgi:hypothetical protein